MDDESYRFSFIHSKISLQRNKTSKIINESMDEVHESDATDRRFKEERQAMLAILNNYFYANAFLHILIIFCVCLLIVFENKYFDIINREDNDRIFVSALYFYYKKHQFYFLDCVDSCPRTYCEGLDLKMLLDTYELTCGNFAQMSYFGLSFVLVLSLGNILGVFNLGIVVLLIMERITLAKAEIIFLFTRHETIVYLIATIVYFISLRAIIPDIEFTIYDFFFIGVIILSVLNFLLFRITFYKKLRIMSRI